MPVLLGTTFLDKDISSIHLTERKTLPHYSLPITISMVHEARSAAEKEGDLHIRQEVEEDLALLVKITQGDSKNITATRKVLLKEMCNTSV